MAGYEMSQLFLSFRVRTTRALAECRLEMPGNHTLAIIPKSWLLFFTQPAELSSDTGSLATSTGSAHHPWLQ